MKYQRDTKGVEKACAMGRLFPSPVD